jgi:sigma-B regulation protein RsbU (phosphoserine phosphatase)
MKRLIAFFTQSFQRKLLLFNLLTVILTTVVLFLFLTINMRSITNYSLSSSRTGIKDTVQEYLSRNAQVESDAIWQQLNAAQNNLSVMGKSAQKMVDNFQDIEANSSMLAIPLFDTPLKAGTSGEFTSSPTDPVDVIMPPSLTNDSNAMVALQASALLNLNMQAVKEGNPNNIAIYYIGGPDAPIMRIYPNTHLVDALNAQQALDKLYWRDLYATNVENWTRWYTDATLNQTILSPITVENLSDPVAVQNPTDGTTTQHLILTMFYPLWDGQTNQFAGAIRADVSLNNIIENVLSIKFATSGFAFLMDGQGKIIAMPEKGSTLFGINMTKVELDNLTYYTGTLADSTNSAVKEEADAIQNNKSGSPTINLEDASGNVQEYMITYHSFPALYDSQYQPDNWKIVMLVPTAEISTVIDQTQNAIQRLRQTTSYYSLGIMLAFLVAVSLISIRFTNRSTRDLRTLAHAAEGIKAKSYDLDLKLHTQDEIGQLGQTFQSMASEIREYTLNLEGKVAERTADLRSANEQITRLNEQLRGENLRLGAELEVAQRLQMMVLPPEEETREILDLDIACFMRPADEVGGDYYDVLKVGDVVYIGIGDVTGHGLQSGVIMLMAQTAILTLSKSGEKDMEHMLGILNQVLYKNILRIQESKNMTLAILQYANHEFSMVGQHESVLICRTNGEVEVVDTLNLGLPIGLEEHIEGFIMTSHIHLNKGDLMVLYTDGATEAMNAQKQQFGIPGLKASLARHYKLPVHEIRNHILTDVFAHIGDARIYDDIALMVIRQK